VAPGPGVTARTGRDGTSTAELVDQGGLRGWFTRLESPLAAYYLVLGSTVALVTIGLVMVLSSSSVASLKETGSSYTWFGRQALFAAIALPMTVLAARVSPDTWRRWAWFILLVGIGGLLLVLTPLGYSVNGNRNWISVGPVNLQPSELVKLALVIWAATVLERKHALLHRLPHVLVPIVPVAVLLLALVLVGNDLGTAIVLMTLIGGLLFAAGVPLRVLTLPVGTAGLVVASMVATSPNRMGRIQDWLAGSACTDYYGSCWQTMHAKWALATGGWWGVGLGASREKWSWLPEAHNDFIFAIIGEELGLAGTLAVLALFGLLGYGLLRLILATDDRFVKVATGGVLVWVLGQAMINIGAVLGIFPVVGVPLPLVSSGGSALITTLVALGMVLGFARQVPGAPEALAARPGMVRRSLAVLPGHSRGGGSR
jgi:cell division protein FtsW